MADKKSFSDLGLAALLRDSESEAEDPVFIEKFKLLVSIWQEFDKQIAEWVGTQPLSLQFLLSLVVTKGMTEEPAFNPSSLKKVCALCYWREGFPRGLVNSFCDVLAELFAYRLGREVIPPRPEDHKEAPVDKTKIN